MFSSIDRSTYFDKRIQGYRRSIRLLCVFLSVANVGSHRQRLIIIWPITHFDDKMSSPIINRHKVQRLTGYVFLFCSIKQLTNKQQERKKPNQIKKFQVKHAINIRQNVALFLLLFHRLLLYRHTLFDDRHMYTFNI